MIDFFTEFASNETLAIEGRDVQYSPEITFKIARAGNKHYSRLLDRLYNKNLVVIKSKGDVAEAKSDEILIEVMSKTILLGWTGPVKFKGEALPYSIENAKKLLALKDFRAYVTAQSNDAESFKLVQEEEDAKN